MRIVKFAALGALLASASIARAETVLVTPPMPPGATQVCSIVNLGTKTITVDVTPQTSNSDGVASPLVLGPGQFSAIGPPASTFYMWCIFSGKFQKKSVRAGGASYGPSASVSFPAE